jgi:alkyldihydroxyacetonephosphate synthase
MLRIWDEAETAFVTGLRLARSGRDAPPYVERLKLLLKRAPRRGALVIVGYEGEKRGTAAAFRPAAQAFRRAKGTALGARAGALWRKSRYEAPYLREVLMARGLGIDTFETAAPWSRLGELRATVVRGITEAANRTLGKDSGKALVFAHVSHCYVEGASLNVTAIFPRSDEPLEQWQTIKRAAMEAFIAAGGTISHQHGLGADNTEWAAAEKGETGLKIIEAVRRELDPKGVMAVGASSGFKAGAG